jgi:hypothetical protein
MFRRLLDRINGVHIEQEQPPVVKAQPVAASGREPDATPEDVVLSETVGFDGKPVDMSRTKDFEIDPHAIKNSTVAGGSLGGQSGAP